MTSSSATYTALDDLTHYRPTLKRKLDVVKSSEFVEMEPGLGEYVKVEDVRRLLSAGRDGVCQTCGTADGYVPRVSPLADAPLISEELIKGSSSNPQAVPCYGGKFEDRPYGGEGDSIAVCSICNQPAGDHRDIVAVRPVPTSATGPNELIEVLNDIEEFLGDQQDVRDGSDGAPQPNKAMSLLTELAVARTNWARAEYRRSTVANIDRSEAVNLASNILEDQYGLHLTRKGIRSLAEAVMRMDEVLRTRSATTTGRANVPCMETAGCPDYDKCCNAGRCQYLVSDSRNREET